MARERLFRFRGKRKDNGEWVFGSLINNAFFWTHSKAPIFYIFQPAEDFDSFDNIQDDLDIFDVVPESVGQFVGITILGTRLFDGDIIKVTPPNATPAYFRVFWSDSDMSFRVRNSLMPDSDGWGRLSRLVDLFFNKPDISVEIVGNWFDNPNMEKL